jgi:hypothetical protein
MITSTTDPLWCIQFNIIHIYIYIHIHVKLFFRQTKRISREVEFIAFHRWLKGNDAVKGKENNIYLQAQEIIFARL